MITAIARTWIGTPYKHRESKKQIGCDCLGLIIGVWREFTGYEFNERLPNYSPTWNDHRRDDPLLHEFRQRMDKVTLQDNPEVVLFKMRPSLAAKHCGIYTGENTIIHAVSGSTVQEVPFTDFWSKKSVAFFKFRRN